MNKSEIKPIEILADSPITGESQDLLRRTPFVEALYQEIINLPFEDSFCFGLYGVWGEGKTSVLNLLKNKLQQNRQIILFEFDPWYLASKEAVLKNFLEGLEGKLRPEIIKNPFIRFFKRLSVFKKYFKKLSLGASVAGTGGQIAWEYAEKGPFDLKEEINTLIRKSGRKILILIDDIDRLQPDEILLVFKLVKLIADFKRTVFILSFAAEATKGVLQKQYIDIDYIDKIVQKPIPLPKVEQTNINQFLDSAFDELFKKLNLDNQRIEEELKEFSLVYQQHARKLFITLRDVKRYVNSLLSSLPPVVNEVHLFDFFILEIIKVFAPRIYTDIYENWQLYVPQRTSNESERWLNPLKWKNGQEKEPIVKEHIEQLLHSEPQKEVFTNLLDSLFPRFSSEEDARREKRIYSTSFLKYFTLRVPSLELSDESIEREISSWNSNRLSSNELWEKLLQYKRDGKLSELLDKLVVFMDLVDQRTAQELIRCIYRNSSSFQKDKTVFLLLNEWDRAIRLVFFIINKKLGNECIPTLEEVMRVSDTLDFAVTIYNMVGEKGKRWFSTDDLAAADKGKLRRILIERFENAYIRRGQNFFESHEPIYVLFLLWNLCAKEEKTTLKECGVSKYIEDKLKEKPEYIGKLLNSFVPRPIDEEKPFSRGFPISKAEKYLDIDKIYSTIKNENHVFYSTDQEEEAIQLFCKAYKESKEKST